MKQRQHSYWKPLSVSLLSCLAVACAKESDKSANSKAQNKSVTVTTQGTMGNNNVSRLQSMNGQTDSDLSKAQNKAPLVRRDLSKKFVISEVNQIRQKLEKQFDGLKDENQKKLNADLAEDILGVDLQVLRSSATADVKMVLKSKKKGDQRIDFSGHMGAGGEIRLNARLANLRTQYQAQLTCMDRVAADCQVSILTLTKQIGSQKKATAKVLVRHSNSDLDFQLPQRQTQNDSAKSIIELLENTMNFSEQGRTLRTILIDSFEVIKGRSAVSVMLLTRDNQVIGFRGENLKASESTTLTNVKMEKFIDNNVLSFFGGVGEFRRDLQDAITDIFMVENVANEKFGIVMSFGDNNEDNYEQVVFDLIRQRVDTELNKLK